jgi:predicted nucleic acid-binding protein
LRLVVDSSVVVKWFVTELQSAEAKSALDHELVAPQLLVAECANVFWKKAQQNEMAAGQAAINVASISGVVDLFDMSGLAMRAVEIASSLPHPAYDCFYLALAESEGCPLLTADDRLRRKLAEAPHVSFAEVLTLDRPIPTGETT